MLSGFKTFLLRGNVVDFAVGVVIGAAFGAVVTSFTANLLTPLIAAIAGKPDFAAFYFELHGARFMYGTFLNALISFLLVAAAVYYFVVVPVNHLIARSRKEPPPDPTTMKCAECLSEIPVGARRCAYCSELIELPLRG